MSTVWSLSAGMILNMTGYEKRTVRAALVAIPVNVVLAIVLIPSYGYFGAAMASVLSLFLWNLILLHAAIKGPGINPSIFLFFRFPQR